MNINEAVQTYRDLSQTISELKQPPIILFKIIRNKNRLEKVVNEFNEARLLLINRYGKKDDAGNPVITNNNYEIEDTEKFMQEMNELLEQEAKIEFDMIDINQMDGESISYKIMQILSPMLEVYDE